jgi:predicted nuclease of predicted toxin-antitoxin system
MKWSRLPDVDSRQLPNDFKRKTRFLIDEGLGEEVAKYLRQRGYNAVFAGDVGLLGHCDEDVFAYAWRTHRVLLTHDHDFLDDTKFPEHRNPGVIVMAGGDGNQQAMGTAIAIAINVFGTAPGVWEKSKITISADGYMTIRNRDLGTGKLETTRYRRSRRRYERLEDDK